MSYAPFKTDLFIPHPHLCDEINRAIIRSEIEGGVYLEDLERDCILEIRTQNRLYRLVNRGDGDAVIEGHPEFCPTPVLVKIHGSSWGGSMLKVAFVGRGMHLEFRHPGFNRPIVTSRIVEIRQVA
ncbi:MAG: hypothetical protein KIT09_11280 [Bryobacteraceae bacterium]|nr:hypothetical protein [Bryobacteraceae bacterium]